MIDVREEVRDVLTRTRDNSMRATLDQERFYEIGFAPDSGVILAALPDRDASHALRPTLLRLSAHSSSSIVGCEHLPTDHDRRAAHAPPGQPRQLRPSLRIPLDVDVPVRDAASVEPAANHLADRAARTSVERLLLSSSAKGRPSTVLGTSMTLLWKSDGLARRRVAARAARQRGGSPRDR
jgi:hypothetical protein